MRAVQVVGPGQIEFVEISKPELKPGHVIVRPRYLSLCGSDIHMLHYHVGHNYPLPVGTTGHEMVGIVEEVDAPNSGIKAGDWALTLAPAQNAMTECFMAPQEHVFVLPQGTTPQVMLQGQQLGTVIFACKRLPNLVGKSVAVIGQGSAGIYFDFMLRRMGASTVIGVDQIEARLQAAKQFGATHTVNNSKVDALEAVAEITGGQLVDLVVEAAGEPSSINLAPYLMKQYGHLLYFGIPRALKIEFDFRVFFSKYGHTISNSGAAREPGHTSTKQALQMLARGEIDVEPLLTHTFAFERVADAYEMAYRRSDDCIKILVELNGG